MISAASGSRRTAFECLKYNQKAVNSFNLSSDIRKFSMEDLRPISVGVAFRKEFSLRKLKIAP